jgi:hypothetical protein
MIRIWEVEMMLRLGETEEQYTKRTTSQRATLIAAVKIPDLIKSLSENKAVKDAKH